MRWNLSILYCWRSKSYWYIRVLIQTDTDSAHSAFDTQDQRIDQVQTHVIDLINSNSKYDVVMTKMAHVINQIQSNDALPAVASQSPTELETILAAVVNL